MIEFLKWLFCRMTGMKTQFEQYEDERIAAEYRKVKAECDRRKQVIRRANWKMSNLRSDGTGNGAQHWEAG